MVSIRCIAILAFMSVALAAPSGSQSVGQAVEAIKKEGSLQDQWTFGNCGTFVNSQTLVYYDHVKIQANSASTTLTDVVSWTGTKRIYCVELIGNQGTQLRISSGGVSTTSIQVSGVSAVGKDLEAIVYVYAN